MVWPLLAQLGVALLKQDAQNREYEDAQRRHGAQTKMDIMGMRAARAGDSGYMQRALGASKSYPHNPDNGTGLLLGVASGLLAQKGAGDAEDAAAAPSGGINWDTPDRDDDLIDPWARK